MTTMRYGSISVSRTLRRKVVIDFIDGRLAERVDMSPAPLLATSSSDTLHPRPPLLGDQMLRAVGRAALPGEHCLAGDRTRRGFTIYVLHHTGEPTTPSETAARLLGTACSDTPALRSDFHQEAGAAHGARWSTRLAAPPRMG